MAKAEWVKPGTSRLSGQVVNEWHRDRTRVLEVGIDKAVYLIRRDTD
jgi:hypothetical protein